MFEYHGIPTNHISKGHFVGWLQDKVDKINKIKSPCDNVKIIIYCDIIIQVGD
jgi:hypothetical protein